MQSTLSSPTPLRLHVPVTEGYTGSLSVDSGRAAPSFDVQGDLQHQHVVANTTGVKLDQTGQKLGNITLYMLIKSAWMKSGRRSGLIRLTHYFQQCAVW